MTRSVVVVGILAAAVLVWTLSGGGAIGATGQDQRTTAIAGTILLRDRVLDGFETVGPCAGGIDFADVAVGMTVTVQDQEGGYIGLGTLGEGVHVVPDGGDRFCQFPFALTGLPEFQPAERWVILIGEDGRRGRLVLAPDDLVGTEGRLDLTLGYS